MKTVSRLLKSKGQDIWSLPPDASVYRAIEMMAQKKEATMAGVMRRVAAMAVLRY